MKAILKIVSGPLAEEYCVLTDGANYTIGRSSEADWNIKDEQTSRLHCIIWVRDRNVLIRDLGSRNGTYLGNDQIPPGDPKNIQNPFPSDLQWFPGVPLFIGDTHIELVLEQQPDAERPAIKITTPGIAPQQAPIPTGQPMQMPGMQQHPMQPAQMQQPMRNAPPSPAPAQGQPIKMRVQGDASQTTVRSTSQIQQQQSQIPPQAQQQYGHPQTYGQQQAQQPSAAQGAPEPNTTYAQQAYAQAPYHPQDSRATVRMTPDQVMAAHIAAQPLNVNPMPMQPPTGKIAQPIQKMGIKAVSPGSTAGKTAISVKKTESQTPKDTGKKTLILKKKNG